MAEFLSQDEIDALLDIAEQVEDYDYDYKDDRKKIRYNESLSKFYKTNDGYDTEDEAMFRYYVEKMEILNDKIKKRKDMIIKDEIEINKIKTIHCDLFMKFSEELL